METLLDILIIIAAIVIGAILTIVIVATLAWLFGDTRLKSVTKKSILYVSVCDGMCNHCNEELKQICEEIKHDT